MMLVMRGGGGGAQPNFRGSTGYGEDCIQALPGHAGSADVADCMAALHAAVDRGTPGCLWLLHLSDVFQSQSLPPSLPAPPLAPPPPSLPAPPLVPLARTLGWGAQESKDVQHACSVIWSAQSIGIGLYYIMQCENSVSER